MPYAPSARPAALVISRKEPSSFCSKSACPAGSQSTEKAWQPLSTRKMSRSPSRLKSRKAPPPPIVSIRYFSAVAPLTCSQSMPAESVMSTNSTTGACCWAKAGRSPAARTTARDAARHCRSLVRLIRSRQTLMMGSFVRERKPMPGKPFGWLPGNPKDRKGLLMLSLTGYDLGRSFEQKMFGCGEHAS